MAASPQDIGPYRVLGPLGQGGMGTVWLAADARLNRRVALKFVAGPDAASDSAREQLLREARAAASLNHPHIASVHDVLDVDGQVVIVFEHVEGQTLATRLARGRLAPDEAMVIGYQLSSALVAAHAHGIVHRDLKPANIVLTPDGQIKVLDFGVARVLPAGADTGSVAHTTAAGFVGTVGYAAPEQCFGHSVDARADLFSLGVVLFEMLTGGRPFPGKDAATVLRSMVHGEAPRLTSDSGVPAPLAALVARLLAVDPSKRPATAREVRDQLQDLAPTRVHTRVVAPRRHPWALTAVVAAVVAIGALVSSLWLRPAAPAADRPPVVAVLPLTNASGDPGKDYLAVGMADNLVTRLAALPSINVLSRSAVANLGNDRDIPSMASELGATYLVDGTVQQIDDTLRISLNLLRPDSSVAWADTVEGPFHTVFDLQTRLASALAQALSVHLSAADRKSLAAQPTMDPAALEAYWRGRALLDRRDIRGNTQAALAAFDQAIRLDPHFADAHAARGEALWDLYLSKKDPALAKSAVDAGISALRLEPDRPTVRYSLALTLKGRGELEQAAEELQRALALRPNYDDARRELGDVLARQGRVDEAIAEFEKAIALRPNFWAHHHALGVSLLRAARYDEAAEAFTRAIALQPDNASAHLNLGAAYHFMGRLEDALTSYQRAVAIGPSSSAYSNIGAIHHNRGEFAEAVSAYRAALELVPNAAATHRNLGDAYRRLGRAADARAAYREAVRLAKADLSVNPRDPLANASLAVYAAKAGDWTLARQQLSLVRQLAPSNVDVLYRVAVVHALAGETEAAMDALEAAIAGGYSRSEAAEDDDFRELSDHPRFLEIVNARP